MQEVSLRLYSEYDATHVHFTVDRDGLSPDESDELNYFGQERGYGPLQPVYQVSLKKLNLDAVKLAIKEHRDKRLRHIKLDKSCVIRCKEELHNKINQILACDLNKFAARKSKNKEDPRSSNGYVDKNKAIAIKEWREENVELDKLLDRYLLSAKNIDKAIREYKYMTPKGYWSLQLNIECPFCFHAYDFVASKKRGKMPDYLKDGNFKASCEKCNEDFHVDVEPYPINLIDTP
jgi:hypothetical protein